MAAQQPGGVPCAHCQIQPPPYLKARAPLVYAFPADNALKALKFRRQLWYVPAFASLLLPLLQEEFPDCDALVPVPLHGWRQAKRGFNQAFEICRPLRKASGLRIVTDIKRVRATRSQSGLCAAARRKNLRDAFAVPEHLTCRRPLVIDDVITTGATVTQLARILLKAGAESVSVLAVARARQC
jgi:ComF family protein